MQRYRGAGTPPPGGSGPAGEVSPRCRRCRRLPPLPPTRPADAWGGTGSGWSTAPAPQPSAPTHAPAPTPAGRPDPTAAPDTPRTGTPAAGTGVPAPGTPAPAAPAPAEPAPADHAARRPGARRHQPRRHQPRRHQPRQPSPRTSPGTRARRGAGTPAIDDTSEAGTVTTGSFSGTSGTTTAGGTAPAGASGAGLHRYHRHRGHDRGIRRRRRPAGRPRPARGGTPNGAAAPTATTLPEERATEFKQRWRDLQADFVDDPQQAVRSAEELARDVLDALTAKIADKQRRRRLEGRRGQRHRGPAAGAAAVPDAGRPPAGAVALRRPGPQPPGLPHQQQRVRGERAVVGDPRRSGPAPRTRPALTRRCRMSCSLASRAVGPGVSPVARKTSKPWLLIPYAQCRWPSSSSRSARSPVSSASSARASAAGSATPAGRGALRELPVPPATG